MSLVGKVAGSQELKGNLAIRQGIDGEAMVCVNGMTGVQIAELYNQGKKLYAEVENESSMDKKLVFLSGGNFTGSIVFYCISFDGPSSSPKVLWLYISEKSTRVVDFTSYTTTLIASVYNGLDTTYYNGKSLSAYQGYVLDQKIGDVQAILTELQAYAETLKGGEA